MGCMADFIPTNNIPVVRNQPENLAPYINHRHPLKYEINANLKTCLICGYKKNEYSYSCTNCTFFACESCCHLIAYGTKLVPHVHPFFTEIGSPRCKICNKSYIDRLNFNCMVRACYFAVCPYCYIAEFQNPNFNRGRIND